AFSWISSSEVITQCGATPVFVDVDSLTYTIDIQAVQRKITSRAKAIVAVHLFGQSAQVGELHNICKKNGLFLIEDCAQAHLTAEGEHYAGTFGDINAFSFYPTKNLGAYGDAGCLVTHDDQLAEKARRLANHGALQKDDHLIEGLNSRMDTLQGAVLLAKLPHLKKWNERRYALAQQYTDSLKNIPQLVTPYQRRDTQHTFHLYVIRTRRRNALKEFLFQNGIQTLIHYPQALPNLPAYQHLQLKPSDFPVASALQDDVLSLPIYPELKDEEVTYICSKIRAFFKA
ncbi:MAG: DegT/DnrJ/EryC1/StrS family aminotransferase, partial [Bacteroidota bacterium]